MSSQRSKTASGGAPRIIAPPSGSRRRSITAYPSGAEGIFAGVRSGRHRRTRARKAHGECAEAPQIFLCAVGLSSAEADFINAELAQHRALRSGERGFDLLNVVALGVGRGD